MALEPESMCLTQVPDGPAWNQELISTLRTGQEYCIYDYESNAGTKSDFAQTMDDIENIFNSIFPQPSQPQSDIWEYDPSDLDVVLQNVPEETPPVYQITYATPTTEQFTPTMVPGTTEVPAHMVVPSQQFSHPQETIQSTPKRRPSRSRKYRLVRLTPPHPLARRALACLFCRGRKIACGRSSGDEDDTCNQCQRRALLCVYPQKSYRGRRRLGLHNDIGVDV